MWANLEWPVLAEGARTVIGYISHRCMRKNDPNETFSVLKLCPHFLSLDIPTSKVYFLDLIRIYGATSVNTNS